jgi:hypothetical protein
LGYSVSVVQENVVADSASHRRNLRVAEQLVVAMIRPRFAVEVVERGPSTWVLWFWAGAMIVVGAYYLVVPGGGRLQLPVLASYSGYAYYAPLMLFWALTGAGEIVDAAVNRRSGWGARLVSSLFTIIVFTGSGVILIWLVTPRAGVTGIDPFVGLLIPPIAMIMVLAPLPAAVVNCYQAGACPDMRLTDRLLALAALHCLPLLWAIVLVVAPNAETIDRVVAGGVAAIGFVLARLLRAEGRERVGGRGRHGSR